MCITAMKNFLDVDYQIELNEKRLEFYNASYQKTQAKFTIIMIFYSAFAVYLTQLLFFIGTCVTGSVSELGIIFYIAILGTFLFFLGKSIYYTAKFLIPVYLAYPNKPEFFYKDIAEQYRQNGVPEEHLNAKIKDSYLDELETALVHNTKAFQEKSGLFFQSLMNAIFALLPFIIALSIYMVHKDDTQKVIILNRYQTHTNNEQ